MKIFFKATLLILALSLMLVSCSKEDGRPHRVSGGGGAAPVFKSEQSSSEDTAGERQTSTNYTARVALTFDDGPHAAYTREIADELAKYGYHATFFVVGNRVDGTAYGGADAMKYAAGKGNEIAIHAYTHDYYYDKCTDEQYKSELSKTESAILSQLPNAKVRLMRPVGGLITDKRVQSSRYSVIMWSIDSEDWRYKSTDKAQENVDTIVEGIMDGVENGDIILMHDIYSNTVEATREVLKQLNERGFEVVTVSELLGSGMKQGQMYYYKSKNMN